MSNRLVVIAGTLLSMAFVVGSASANVGPSAPGAGQTQITPPKASTFVAPNILPRLLVVSLPGR
jgi:hypothetical protein